MANTLAYYDTVTITAVKSFIVQAPEHPIQYEEVRESLKNQIEKLFFEKLKLFEKLGQTYFFHIDFGIGRLKLRAWGCIL